MKLSVSIIARNEAHTIGRAMESARRLANEIVVTDTGSEDQTVEIAQSMGARIAHFDWCDDFSAAYNYCIDQSRGEWILQLDADEQLLPASVEAVRLCIANPTALAYTVLRRDFYGSGDESYTKMLHVRLFRNRPDLRFVGRIHHKFITPLDEIAVREKLEVLPSSVELLHHGYATGDQQAKLARAAKLMELELRDRPGQFYYLVELGRTWLKMRDERGAELLAQAAHIAKHDLHQAMQAPGLLAALLEHLLACDRLPKGFPLTHADAEQLAQQHFNTAVPVLWQRALRAFKAANFDACAQLLEQIIDLGKTEGYDQTYSFQPEIMRGDALLNLGVCYANLGRLPAARKCFEQLSTHEKLGSQAKRNLQLIGAK